jgi:hypothetical protein
MLDHNSFYKHLSTEQEIWRHPRMLSMFGAGSRMVLLKNVKMPKVTNVL